MIEINYTTAILVFAIVVSFVVGFCAGGLNERSKISSSGIEKDARRYRWLKKSSIVKVMAFSPILGSYGELYMGHLDSFIESHIKFGK